MNNEQLYNAGVKAIKQGDIEKGRKILRKVLSADKTHVMGWLWYSKTESEPGKRLQAVKQALKIDSSHADARKLYLLYLDEVQSQSNSPGQESYPFPDDNPVSVESHKKFGRLLARTSMSTYPQVRRVILVIFLSMGINFALDVFPWSGFYSALGQGFDFNVPDIQGGLFGIVVLSGLAGTICYQTYRFYITWKQELYVYEQGLVHKTMRGEKNWFWSDFNEGKYLEARVGRRRFGIQTALIRYHLFYIDLYSEKGNFHFDFTFSDHAEVGHVILKAAHRYVVIEENTSDYRRYHE